MANVPELPKATPESAIAKAIVEQEDHIRRHKALLADALLQKQVLENQTQGAIAKIGEMEGRLDTLRSTQALLRLNGGDPK